MSDLDRVFSRKALISHIIAGYPDIETTGRLIPAMADAGVDMIIVEIPFSDPISGGPEIQGVHATALSAGVTTDSIFDMIEGIRGTCDVPIAVMTYYNPVFVYGPEAFVDRCVFAGVSSLLVPDLPFEERMELRPICDARGVHMVSMIAPTYEDRMRRIVSESTGYVYILRFVDQAGFPEGYVHDPEEMAAICHEAGLRCIMDTGTGEAGSVLAFADGAVDGTDVMTLVLRHGRECVQFVADYARGVRTRI